MPPPSIRPAPGPALLRRPWLAAALLTPVVFFIHGFHPFANDAALYTAGIRHILQPSLYPLNAVFVTAFARYSLFPWTIAALVRLLHLPLTWLLLLAQLGSIWLFLFACWRLAASLSASFAVRWAALLLAAGCFTLPVAGTALSLMDPYVTPRSFSTPLAILAVAAIARRARLSAVLFLLLALLVHPLMGVYACAFVGIYAALDSRPPRLALGLCGAALLAAALAFLLAHGRPVPPAYRQAVSLPPRSFLFLARWHSYEILGLILPLLLLAIVARRAAPGPIRTLCLTSILTGVTSTLLAALFVPPAGPYLLVPLQCLRSFHLIYAAGVVLAGSLLGALLRRSPAAALTLLAALFAGMFAAQTLSWPHTRHIEWPGTSPRNPWTQAFLWIRLHTPADAVFAFDPHLVYLPEENEQGFRVLTARDHLADDKDAGIVAVLPDLAPRWALQRNAQAGVDRLSDAQRLARLAPLGATWLLLPPGVATGFPCPWSNAVVRICKMAP